MRGDFLVFKILWLTLSPKFHIHNEAGVVDTLLLLLGCFSEAVMLWCLFFDDLMELLIVLLESGLFFIAQQLL